MAKRSSVESERDHQRWEYAPMRIAADMKLSAAAALLAAQAGAGGWELARVLKYPDGSRQVVMRRSRRHDHLPLPIV
ncbi:MAG: DUF5703 family protein [Antricoccus sp.]